MTRGYLATVALAATLALVPGRSSAVDSSAAGMPQQETAVLGGGCFWCMEAVFDELEGVTTVTRASPAAPYRTPATSRSAPAPPATPRSCRSTYDPAGISYGELLRSSSQVHDPTTLNRQGADVGTQYRSVIFYHNAAQKKPAHEHDQGTDRQATVFDRPIVTEIVPFPAFYPAEDYHQNYYFANPNAATARS